MELYAASRNWLRDFPFFIDIEVVGVSYVNNKYLLEANLLGAQLLGTRGEMLASYSASDFTAATEILAQAQESEKARQAKQNQAEQQAARAAGVELSRLRAAEQTERDRIAAARKRLQRADILGIRLGMTVAEAEKIIREQMEVGWVADSPKSDSSLPPGGQDPNRPYGEFRSYVSADGTQQIVLLVHPDHGDQVLGVARTVPLPDGVSNDDIMEKLKEKYGNDPAQNDGSRSIWTVDFGEVRRGVTKTTSASVRLNNGTCQSEISIASWRQGGLQILEGEQLSGRSAGIKIKSLTPGIRVYGGRSKDSASRQETWDPGKWSECGPTVLASVRRTNLGTNLNVAIHDLSGYGPLYARRLESKDTQTIKTIPKL